MDVEVFAFSECFLFVYAYNFFLYFAFISMQAEWKEMHSYLEKGAENGWLKPVVGREYKLDDAPQAHNDVINNSGTLGKLVLTLWWCNDLYVQLACRVGSKYNQVPSIW